MRFKLRNMVKLIKTKTGNSIAMSKHKSVLTRADKGIIYAPWERAFTRILTPFDEFIHRQTTSGLLLMGTAIIALRAGK